MAKIFISHNSSDNSKVSELKKWLNENGHESLFIDFDLEDGIVGGTKWQQVLYKKLRRAQVILLCVTENWINSKWCFAEAIIANEKGKRIIPLRMSGCDMPAAFKDVQHVDLFKVPAEGYSRLKTALKDFYDWDTKRSPFPGLAAFQKEDAAIFFGREEEIQSSIQSLESIRRIRGDVADLVVALGASGSGKSSLVRAGILPKLKEDGNWIILDIFRPKNDPLNEIAFVLSGLYQQHGVEVSINEIRNKLDVVDDGDALYTICKDILYRFGKPEGSFLITIDQAEELFADKQAEPVIRFIFLLRKMLERSAGDIIVLCTLRSSSFEKFQNSELIIKSGEQPLKYSTILVSPISRQSFPMIIEKPAELSGITFGPRLVNTMIQDVPDTDALPMLAFTLNQLWESFGKDGEITIDNYNKIGGVSASIRNVAENAMKTLAADEETKRKLRSVFIPSLISVDKDGSYAKRTAYFSELREDAAYLLKPFVDERLLIEDTDMAGKPTIEISHETLIRKWSLLSEWLIQEKDNITAVESFRSAAKEWDNASRSNELLVHRDGRLSEILRLIREKYYTLISPSSERLYLNACVKAEETRTETKLVAEKEKVKQAKLFARRSLFATFFLVVALAAVIVGAIVFIGQRNKAQKASINFQNALGKQAVLLSRDELTLAASLEAAEEASRQLNGNSDKLLDAQAGLTLALSRNIEMQIFNKVGRAFDVFPYNNNFISAATDGKIASWNPRTGEIVKVYDSIYTQKKDEYLFSEMKLSGKGSFFGVIFNDSLLRVYNANTKEKIIETTFGTCDGECLPETRYLFSPDEKFLYTIDKSSIVELTAGSDELGGTAIGAWDLKTGRRLDHSFRVGGKITSFAVSSTGKLMAIATIKGQISLFTVLDRNLQSTVSVAEEVTAMQIIKEDSLLIAGSTRGDIRIWDIASIHSPKSFLTRKTYISKDKDETGGVLKFVISPSENEMITYNSDQCILWKISGQPDSILLENPSKGSYNSVSFTKDGKLFAAANGETVFLYGIDGEIITGYKTAAGYSSIKFSESKNECYLFGDMFGSGVNYIRIWGDDFIKTILTNNGWSISVSGDKKLAAIRIRQDSTRIIDPSGKVVKTLQLNESTRTLSSFLFSADNKSMLVRSDSLHIYDIETGKQIYKSLYTRRGLSAISSKGEMVAKIIKESVSPKGTISLFLVQNLDGDTIFKRTQSGNIKGVFFCDDDRSLLTWSDSSEIMIWNLKDTSQTKIVRGDRKILNMVLSGDRKIAVSAGQDSVITLWDIPGLKTLTSIKYNGSIANLKISADNKKLLITSKERLHIIDVRTHKKIQGFIIHSEDEIYFADFLGNENIISIGEDDLIKIYPISLKAWYEKAKQLVDSRK